MDIVVSKEENVFPIVPGGRKLPRHDRPQARESEECGLPVADLKRRNFSRDLWQINANSE